MNRDSVLREDPCPVCAGGKGDGVGEGDGEGEVVYWASDKRREYSHCLQCGLVYVPKQYHISAQQEKAEYDMHRNEVHDVGYRRFLSRVTDPLISRLNPGASGLDFGCGPGPALVAVLEEAGFRCAKYDLYYFPDASPLQERYDFICATEVIEHLADPMKSLDALWGQLNSGGILALMTKRVTDREAFERWHYKNDPTHICFYAEKTFRWMAERWQAKLEFIDKDVVFLVRP